MTMTCWETVQAYGLRSLGYGENLLPKTDFTLCQHFTLIGSGMIWNIYFGVLALAQSGVKPSRKQISLPAAYMAFTHASEFVQLKTPSDGFRLCHRMPLAESCDRAMANGVAAMAAGIFAVDCTCIPKNTSRVVREPE